MSDMPFRRTTLRWLVITFVFSFAAGIALMLIGPDLDPPRSHGADSLSSSFIGHRAFVELLREVDIPVVVSRYASERKAGDDALLVVAAPRDCPPGSPRGETLASMFDGDCDGLLVLPKWEAEMHPQDRSWVTDLELIPVREGDDVLRSVDAALDVRRVARNPAASWDTSDLDLAPTFPLSTVQLVVGDSIEPLISCPDGVLLGKLPRAGRPLYVLSDPDIICTGGLGLGDNAALIVAAIDRARSRGGAVIFDETAHGHELRPSIWRELFSFPLIVIVLHLAIVLCVLLAAGMQRFGAPRRAAPALEPGHRFLIENTADLLRYRGQPRAALTSYFKTTVHRVREALRAPSDLDAQALEAWLDRIGDTRGATDAVRDLHTAVRTAAADAVRVPRSRGHLVRTAHRIHRWREEILHGPSDRTRHS